MEQPEKNELSDGELDALLVQWKAPEAPAHLRTALFPGSARPWWLRAFAVSIRVPLPIAAALAIVLSLTVWRLSVPARSRVDIGDGSSMQPVTELRPRIIRRGNVQN